MPDTVLRLSRHDNQARGLAAYARDFLAGRWGPIGAAARARLELFHLDSVACAVAALAADCNAPRVLREEALRYAVDDAAAGAACFGSATPVQPEKAVVANCAAVRELDANGTNFGYHPGDLARQQGEFGHNDFYPVVVAGAALAGAGGEMLLRGMLCLDEIRGRLAEVYSLKTHKIDHVVHGAIAAAAVYGALRGASVDQIESAIGLVVAHAVPFRAIRHGQQLSDSKGASAALAAEGAVLAVERARRGFVGPADIFRNPQALFCLFEPPAVADTSPFDLTLTTHGDDFAILGMHFKLGLYEHQSAGAIQGVIDLLQAHGELLADEAAIRRVQITIYEPAFSIIGDPHKRDPQTRQSADHSMVYIVATLLRKALESGRAGWRELMLTVDDYSDAALRHPVTRRLMERIDFAPGGPEYDRRYPDGIPTTLEIDHARLGRLASNLVMHPLGHARCASDDLADVLAAKFDRLAGTGVDAPAALRTRLTNLADQSPDDVRRLYSFPIRGLA